MYYGFPFWMHVAFEKVIWTYKCPQVRICVHTAVWFVMVLLARVVLVGWIVHVWQQGVPHSVLTCGMIHDRIHDPLKKMKAKRIRIRTSLRLRVCRGRDIGRYTRICKH